MIPDLYWLLTVETKAEAPERFGFGYDTPRVVRREDAIIDIRATLYYLSRKCRCMRRRVQYRLYDYSIDELLEAITSGRADMYTDHETFGVYYDEGAAAAAPIIYDQSFTDFFGQLTNLQKRRLAKISIVPG